MSIDILILNTAVVDFRVDAASFPAVPVSEGGLTRFETRESPGYSQEKLQDWIMAGKASAGGPGNTAPLMAGAGLQTAVGVNLGAGYYGGLDAQGRFFHDTMRDFNIDMSATFVHPGLPTATTYINTGSDADRGGIAYFPGANDDFDFTQFKSAVARLEPKIVYYMYSGLSKRGDANGGRDLAEFMAWCRKQGCLTIADSHTLSASPGQAIRTGETIPEYLLLKPLLAELDIFFTSSDEAKMIVNTFSRGREWEKYGENENNRYCLEYLYSKFYQNNGARVLLGITYKKGAFAMYVPDTGVAGKPARIKSKFLADETVDLVGAGDSFRAGLLTYMAFNLPDFGKEDWNTEVAVQMGNFFASRYIQAPLEDRYRVEPYQEMLAVCCGHLPDS